MSASSTFDGLQKGHVRLPGKEKAKLAYTVKRGPDTPTDMIIVFLNGLMLPRLLWEDVMVRLDAVFKKSGLLCPTLLSYDRYGQGDSESDPSDVGKEEGFGHDALDATKDLHLLLQTFLSERLNGFSLASTKIVLVANSLGCAIARLFTQTYPGLVAGLLFLDSIIANSDLVSFFPNPDAAGFDEKLLPHGVTPDMLRDARAKYTQVFHPSVRNPEGISRRNLTELLPRSNAPKLEDENGHSPYLLVVGHDPEKFADDGWSGPFKIPRILSMTYHSPFWHKYNTELVQLVDPTFANGPLIALRCGHFIQRDDPDQVATLIAVLFSAIKNKRW